MKTNANNEGQHGAIHLNGHTIHRALQRPEARHINTPVGLLDASGGGCGLASGLGGQLLAGCLAAGGLAGCLLGASHALCLLIAEGMNVKGNAQESFADQEIVVSFVSACVR